MIYIRNKVITSILEKQKAKNIYSFILLLIGAFSGTLLFWGLTELHKLCGFNISYGHGEIIIAAMAFNLFISFISFIFIISGRIIIGWKNLLL